MKKTLLCSLVLLLAAAIGLVLPLPPVHAQSQLSRVAGRFIASNYNYRGGSVATAPTTTGAGTITLVSGLVTTADGHSFNPYSTLAPIVVGSETVTPTTVSGCGNTTAGACSITATFVSLHGQGEPVTSGTFGLNEAIIEAHNSASGPFGSLVTVGPEFGGTDATLSASIAVFSDISIEDTRYALPQVWSLVGNATAIATPTTLIAATAGFGVNGATSTGGTYTGSNTYITCISYVDIMGQEGPCSATFTIATSGVAATNQIGYTAPAASTGAVGYTIYITLNGGAYNLSYKVPLVTQPTVSGVYPAANGVCTLTNVETVTPACALTNTTYGQTGVGAVVSALTLNTSPINPEATVISTTSVYVPNPGGRTAYVYSPGSHVATLALPATSLPFTISAAAATTVPAVIGTINIQPGFMNYVGRTIEICGFATTTASTGTIKNIQFQWDAIGQNTAGKGVPIADLTVTQTSTTVTQLDFCQKFQTTVAAATATGGTIAPAGGYLTSTVATLVAAGAGGEVLAGGVGSLNLAGEARINVIYLHTTGTDGAAVTLQNLSVRVI